MFKTESFYVLFSAIDIAFAYEPQGSRFDIKLHQLSVWVLELE